MDPLQIYEEIAARDFPAAVRISAAHLVTTISVVGENMSHPIAMLSVGMHKRGQLRFDALGGAIAFGQLGVEYIKRFGATEPAYDAHDGTYDARFIVPNKEHAHSALAWLANLENGKSQDVDFFETTPHREVFGELTGEELVGILPVCGADDPDWESVSYRYYGWAIQPAPVGDGTSVNETAVPSCRLFHGWEMRVPRTLFGRIVSADQIRLLTPKELASTNGGTQKGSTSDRIPLGDNLGIRNFVR